MTNVPRAPTELSGAKSAVVWETVEKLPFESVPLKSQRSVKVSSLGFYPSRWRAADSVRSRMEVSTTWVKQRKCLTAGIHLKCVVSEPTSPLLLGFLINGREVPLIYVGDESPLFWILFQILHIYYWKRYHFFHGKRIIRTGILWTISRRLLFLS